MSPAEGRRRDDTVNGRSNAAQREGRGALFERMQYLLGEESLDRGQVSAVVVGLQAVLFLT